MRTQLRKGRRITLGKQKRQLSCYGKLPLRERRARITQRQLFPRDSADSSYLIATTILLRYGLPAMLARNPARKRSNALLQMLMAFDNFQENAGGKYAAQLNAFAASSSSWTLRLPPPPFKITSALHRGTEFTTHCPSQGHSTTHGRLGRTTITRGHSFRPTSAFLDSRSRSQTWSDFHPSGHDEQN